MFGEHGIYADGKLFGTICDNRVFIKPTIAGRAYIGYVIEVSPYPGAKSYFFIENKLEDKDWLSELVRVSVDELSLTRKKK